MAERVRNELLQEYSDMTRAAMVIQAMMKRGGVRKLLDKRLKAKAESARQRVRRASLSQPVERPERAQQLAPLDNAPAGAQAQTQAMRVPGSRGTPLPPINKSKDGESKASEE